MARISNQGLWLRDRSNLGEMLIKGSYLDTGKTMIKDPVFFLINSDTLPAKRIDDLARSVENQSLLHQ